MRLDRRPAVLIFALLLAASPALAGGDVRLLFGQRASAENLFDDVGVDAPAVAGVMLDLDLGNPVSLAVDLLWATDDDTRPGDSMGTLIYTTEVDTVELDLGLRRSFRLGNRFHPYLGGGVALARMDLRQTVAGDLGVPGSEYEDTIIDDHDVALGVWANAGLLFRCRAGFSLGADVRYTNTDLGLWPVGEPESVSFDAGGVGYAVTLGYAW